MRGDDEMTDQLARLTDAERRILTLVGEGLTNRQIAERLGLAEKTVKNHVSRLLGKLGLERRTQAAVLVTKLGSPA
jgi:two-component system response regulator DevR